MFQTCHRRHPENERCRQLASSKFCCGTRNVRYLALWSTLAVPIANFGLIKFLELSSSVARQVQSIKVEMWRGGFRPFNEYSQTI